MNRKVYSSHQGFGILSQFFFVNCSLLIITRVRMFRTNAQLSTLSYSEVRR
jgi:hypothetical protein